YFVDFASYIAGIDRSSNEHCQETCTDEVHVSTPCSVVVNSKILLRVGELGRLFREYDKRETVVRVSFPPTTHVPSRGGSRAIEIGVWPEGPSCQVRCLR